MRIVAPFALLLLTAALCVDPPPLAAQGVATAGIRGTAADSAGTPIAAAIVRLLHPATGAEASTITDDGGRFLFVGLAPGGPYTVTFSHIGFASLTREPVFLQGGQNLRLDVRLTPRAAQLTGIEVRVERDAVISAARTGAATLLGERAIHTAPVLSRNAIELAALSPLVTIDAREISIAGQNHRYNSLRVDGAMNQDVFGLSPSGVPGGEAFAKPLPLDAVQQYQILVAPFDVRQSGFTGGILNAVTRSGTNEWRGSAAGFYRDAVFGGNADDAFAAGSASGDFTTRLLALSGGGPLQRDRTHVYFAGELEWRNRPVPGFSFGSADPVRYGVAPDSILRITRILEDGYGVAPGSPEQYTLRNPLANLFARVDHRIGADHRLSGRYSYAAATNDAAPNRAPIGHYELASNAHRFASRTHGASLQLISALGAGITSEILFNVQRTRDRTTPNASFPEIDVDVASVVPGAQLRRRVRAGAASTAQRNELDQDVMQLSASFSRGFGQHVVTAGVDVERFGIRHLFVPSDIGTYRYNSIAQLAANTPATFERTIINDAYDPAVRFSVVQPAAFLQTEWTAAERLTLTLGVRADVPRMPSNPEPNAELAAVFDPYTHELPASGPLISPRFGFNWSRGTEHRSQIRGGTGVFSGRPPLNWLADAYRSTGLRSHLLICSGAAAPAMNQAAPPPTQCRTGTGQMQRQVVFFDRDFRFPQDWRTSLAIDQELPAGFVLTVEGVFTRAMHQVDLRDLNIGPEITDITSRPGYTPGFGNRPYYGLPRLPVGYTPGRVVPGYGPIIQVMNGQRNYAFGTSIEIQRRFSERLDVRAAYSYNGSSDTRSLAFPDAAMNFGMTALRGDPNRPELTYSDYHRPHKLLVTAWSRLAERGGGTDLSLLYVGQSGRPYSYVYAGDANGDGYPGAGGLADANNDLVYVPTLHSEIPAGIVSSIFWYQLSQRDPCLRSWFGQVIGRNVCSAPWSHRVDLRLTQALRPAGRRVSVVADVMNLLNLVNSDWGLVQEVQPRIPVLQLVQRAEGAPGQAGEQYVAYVGPRGRDPVTGQVGPMLPFTPVLPDSHWRAQLGIRIEL